MKGVIEKLMFTIGMKDMASPHVVALNKNLTGLKHNAQSGFGAITGGALGVGAAAYALDRFMAPVKGMQEALGEVKSLDVSNTALKQLEKTSLRFSIAYGESAEDFVRSSYDIQSAISGLTGAELSQFTKASNVLAKGTKADASVITSYMGSMYGIFKTNADAMGKSNWVNQLTGQTATAVKMFKTTGAEMAGAFESVGAMGSSRGIAMNEQMAILGQLQATMSGSEAGTKYSAFLAGAVKAQEKLGLSFTDSNGRMLPMLDILSKLQDRYGATFTEIESLELQQAFGTKEAVQLIQLLMNDTAGLATNIDKLGKINGMRNAEKMAKSMVQPWDQFKSVTQALRISFGNALLPTIIDGIQRITNGLDTLFGWTQEFPNLTRAVGLFTLGILGLGMATGTMSILFGSGKILMVSFHAAMILLRTSMLAAKGAAWLFNAALLANPITLVVIGILGAVAAVAALIWKWDELKAWFNNSDLMAPVRQQMANVMFWVDKGIAKFQSFVDWGKNFKAASGEKMTAIIGSIGGYIEKLQSRFKSFLDWGAGIITKITDIASGVLEVIDNIIGKVKEVKDFGWLPEGQTITTINESVWGSPAVTGTDYSGSMWGTEPWQPVTNPILVEPDQPAINLNNNLLVEPVSPVLNLTNQVQPTPVTNLTPVTQNLLTMPSAPIQPAAIGAEPQIKGVSLSIAAEPTEPAPTLGFAQAKRLSDVRVERTETTSRDTYFGGVTIHTEQPATPDLLERWGVLSGG